MSAFPIKDTLGRKLPLQPPPHRNPVLSLIETRPVEMEPPEFWDKPTDEIEAFMRLKYPELQKEKANV